MKLLLDENLPKELKLELRDHDVFTVRELGWNGKHDGEILTLMKLNGFDALLTFDKRLCFQQNFSKHPVAVLELHAETNQLSSLITIVPHIRLALTKLQPGRNVVQGPPSC